MAKLNIKFSPQAWEEYQGWYKEDPKTIKRVNKLITEILSSPFEGTGKPEPLKYELQGVWSRRIDSANRLVYIVTDTEIQIIQVKYHY